MSGDAETIVFISEDPLSSEAMKFALDTKNLVVYSYDSIKEALKHIILTPPDLVIIDDLQSGLKPGDIVAGIRRKIKDFHQPFLFILDPPFTGKDIEHYDPEIDGYIERPYSLDRMIETVFFLLKKELPVEPNHEHDEEYPELRAKPELISDEPEQTSSVEQTGQGIDGTQTDTLQSIRDGVQTQSELTREPDDNWLDRLQPLDEKPQQEVISLIGTHGEEESSNPDYPRAERKEDYFDPQLKGYMGTILVIDDEPFIIRILKTILEAEGYRVITADNGLDGMKKCKEIIPDVILVDLMMPELDGYEFIEIMRAEQDFDKVPIIILSARPLTKDQGHAFKLGANFYMQKPIEKDKLLNVIDNLIHQS